MKRKVIFRADGNSRIGLGHVFRVTGLAQKLASFERIFITFSEIKSLQSQIAASFDRVHYLERNEGYNWLDELTGSEIVVFDGYQFNEEDQLAVKAKGCYLVMIDDIHEQRFIADAIINSGGEDLHSFYDTVFHTRFFFGFQYAILRNGFHEAKQETVKRNGFNNSDGCFVCLGGADPFKITLKVLDQIVHAGYKRIAVLVSDSYSNIEEITSWIKSHPHVELYKNLDEWSVVNLMKSCGTAICSASTVAYEYLCTGGKLFVIKTADNQGHVYEYLVNKKVANEYKEGNQTTDLSWTVLKSFLEKENNYEDLFKAFSFEMQCSLKVADYSDSVLYFNWVNDPAVRTQSFNEETIKWEDHQKWFSTRLNDPDCILFKLMVNDLPAGQIRLQVEHTDSALINYSIDEKWRGKGLGKIILKLSILESLKLKPSLRQFIGYVKKENTPSRKAFLRNNFEEEIAGQKKDSYKYILTVK